MQPNPSKHSITIDLEEPIELTADEVQDPNLMQGISLTLQAMRTISHNKIKYTSFNQVIAAHAAAEYRRGMNSKEQALNNLLQNYLNSSGEADDADLAVKYIEDVY